MGPVSKMGLPIEIDSSGIRAGECMPLTSALFAQTKKHVTGQSRLIVYTPLFTSHIVMNVIDHSTVNHHHSTFCHYVSRLLS